MGQVRSGPGQEETCWDTSQQWAYPSPGSWTSRGKLLTPFCDLFTSGEVVVSGWWREWACAMEKPCSPAGFSRGRIVGAPTTCLRFWGLCGASSTMGPGKLRGSVPGPGCKRHDGLGQGFQGSDLSCSPTLGDLGQVSTSWVQFSPPRHECGSSLFLEMGNVVTPNFQTKKLRA